MSLVSRWVERWRPQDAATGTFSRRDGARDIEAADMAGLRTQVPGGWILLHVRST